jgi:hypothetical protein
VLCLKAFNQVKAANCEMLREKIYEERKNPLAVMESNTKEFNTLRHNRVWQDDSFVVTLRHALFRLRDSTGYGQGSNRCSEQLRGYAVHGNLK